MTNPHSGHTTREVKVKKEIYNYRFPPFLSTDNGRGSTGKGHTLYPDNYEWPFSVPIEGSMAESVEGLDVAFITYRLRANIAMGKYHKDHQRQKVVRIVRTLDSDALELAHAMTVENIWPNKIEYSIVIPQKAIVFGTAINVEMQFTVLLKGLKIGQIRCSLVEIQEFTIPRSAAGPERTNKMTRDVESWAFELNEEEHYQDMLHETSQGGYILKETMPLPKRLKKCVQDVDVHGLKIRHKVKFNIALHNPDGHVSEVSLSSPPPFPSLVRGEYPADAVQLRATLPVTIFISPNMPIDSEGNLVNQAPTTSTTDITYGAPPMYGEHVLDQLYGGIDPSGYMTPGLQSGMSTPFYSQSRSGSAENLASLDGVANTAIPPSALTARLRNLDPNNRNNSFVNRGLRAQSGSGGNTPHPFPEADPLQPFQHGHGSTASLSGMLSSHGGNTSGPSSLPRPQSGYFDHAPLSRHSPAGPLSRRTSEDNVNSHGFNSALTSGQHTPEHLDYSDLELNKVPSYTTAVKAPVRGMSYSDAGSLPDYETAVSRPASPVYGVNRNSLSNPASGAGTPSHEMGAGGSGFPGFGGGNHSMGYGNGLGLGRGELGAGQRGRQSMMGLSALRDAHLPSHAEENLLEESGQVERMRISNRQRDER